jgi:catechol 2,3-dioxygenase-like lactoylglutathione lyase family enzyme
MPVRYHGPMDSNRRRPKASPVGSGTRLHHVALGARDVERVAAFYRDLLGLREIARHFTPRGALRSVWLDLGGPVLMIERTASRPRRVRGVGAGQFLLAVAASVRRRNAVERSLAAAGVAIETRTEHTIYFRDPEDNRAAVSSFPI